MLLTKLEKLAFLLLAGRVGGPLVLESEFLLELEFEGAARSASRCAKGSIR